jgi:predicted secreted Zn-dependent protease
MGRKVTALTTWVVTWELEKREKVCRPVFSFVVSLTLPKAVEKEKFSKQLYSRWNQFRHELLTHEEEHLETLSDFRAELSEFKKGFSGCRTDELEKKMRSLLRSLDKKNLWIDRPENPSLASL